MLLNPRLIIEDKQKNSKLYPLNNGTNLIGRATTCKVFLENDKKISREHCALVLTDEQTTLIDLGSGNGTFINEERIEKRSLNWGDRFIVGDFNCLYIYDKSTNTVEHERSASITRIPTSIMSDIYTDIATQSTLGLQGKQVDNMFFILSQICYQNENLDLFIMEFLKQAKALLHFESIGFRFRGHQYVISEEPNKFEFLKISSAEIVYNEDTGYLIVPLAKLYSVCQMQRITGFNRLEIEVLSTVFVLFAEACVRRDQQVDVFVGGAYEPKFDLIGRSAPIMKIRETIDKIGDTFVNVLIVGASGTGKEVVAHLLHNTWATKTVRPFIAVNCAAMQVNLFESTFFGHVKGAFTNALDDRKGLFEQAHGGTLFLDELGEMPIEFQAKLLRVIETGEMRPVGSSEMIRINVRIICATHRDLKQMVEKGSFRADLFYRLQVIEIKLPALKDRKEDIPLLVQFFMEQLASELSVTKQITSFGLREIQEYDWPGNIRELKNFLIKVFTLTDSNEIDGNDVRKWIKKRDISEVTVPTKLDILTLEEVEIRHIVSIMKLTNNNKAEAAKLLGITRSTLYEKLKKTPYLQ